MQAWAQNKHFGHVHLMQEQMMTTFTQALLKADDQLKRSDAVHVQHLITKSIFLYMSQHSSSKVQF